MASLDAPTTRLDRPVSVQVGVSPRTARDDSPPAVCVVGLASWSQPSFSSLFPSALIRDSRIVDDDMHVEHLRISAREALSSLPGLEFGRPSRVRDAVRLALAAGGKSVDLVMARINVDGEELLPWDLYRPEFVYAIDTFLSSLVGTCLVFPDIGGPVSMGPGTAHELEERVHRFERTVAAHKDRWSERYQVALLDDVGVGGQLGHRILKSASASDSSICRWVGEPKDLSGHGWRSAAAFVGGVIAARPNDLLSGVSGLKAPLAEGRAVDQGRLAELFVGDRHHARMPEDEYYVDVVPRPDGTGYIRSEPTMRAPVGMWPLPSVRVAKVIHWRIMQAASRFVFESADIGRAVGLATAISKSVQPFTRVGVLTGPQGEGEPIVRGGVIRDPGQPGLRVEINAQLRPWAHRINLNVNLRPGGSPVVKEG